MKLQPKRILAALLAGLLLLSATACATDGDKEETKAQDQSADTVGEEDTGFKPDIEKKDYDCEFVITGVGDVRAWALAEEDSAGDPLEDAIYERTIKIQDHLGVTMIEVDAGD